MHFGQEETATLETRISNEISLQHELDQLNMGLNTATRRLLNFAVNFVGKKTKSHNDWIRIGGEIDTKPLTGEGKLRLRARHTIFKDYVKPQPRPLAAALLPLLIFWLAKSVIGGKLQERKFEKVLEKKRQERRRKQLRDRTSKKAEKASVSSKR